MHELSFSVLYATRGNLGDHIQYIQTGFTIHFPWYVKISFNTWYKKLYRPYPHPFLSTELSSHTSYTVCTHLHNHTHTCTHHHKHHGCNQDTLIHFRTNPTHTKSTISTSPSDTANLLSNTPPHSVATQPTQQHPHPTCNTPNPTQ